MTFSHLEQMKEILGHRWHAPILQCLADGPLRYSKIGAALIQQVGDRPGDGYISSELNALKALGLIAKQQPNGANHHVWALTEDGRRVTATLAGLEQGAGDYLDDAKRDDEVGQSSAR